MYKKKLFNIPVHSHSSLLSHTKNKFLCGIMFLVSSVSLSVRQSVRQSVRAHNLKTAYQNLFKFYRGVSGNGGTGSCKFGDVSKKNGRLAAIFIFRFSPFKKHWDLFSDSYLLNSSLKGLQILEVYLW